ncbi:hypothetical protein CRG98_035804 [Punica granatum]|uniref:Uncharacterized protein n=1 Tax=Punica granatum TaxID=22663 RepID=A0A2I0IJ65_PUNGR|nr:hypothetical protein CRG98_035804 [Punica granatum]
MARAPPPTFARDLPVTGSYRAQPLHPCPPSRPAESILISLEPLVNSSLLATFLEPPSHLFHTPRRREVRIVAQKATSTRDSPRDLSATSSWRRPRAYLNSHGSLVDSSSPILIISPVLRYLVLHTSTVLSISLNIIYCMCIHVRHKIPWTQVMITITGPHGPKGLSAILDQDSLAREDLLRSSYRESFSKIETMGN